MKQYDLVASNAIEEFEGGDFVYADEAIAEIERLNVQVARCKEFIESTLICWSEDYAEVLRIWSDRK